MKALSKQLFQIGQLTQAIIDQPNDPLYIVKEQASGMLEVKPTELAISIEKTVMRCLCQIMEGFPIHGFHPYVHVFVKNALDCSLRPAIEHHRALKKTNDLYQIGVDYEVMLDLISRMRTCIKQIHEITRSVEFKEFIYKAQRAAQKNHEGMMRYLDSLFEHYSRLLVIRIDLTYHKGQAIMNHGDIRRKYWLAKHDLRRLLNNTKMNQLFDHVVGYIWSLEYGPEKGFHYHLFLFFDGAKVREDVTLAKLVGEYWESKITRSRGSYWNCNAHKDEYPECGIGMIHYNDVEKINILKQQAATYLTKVDHYVRMLTPDNGRTFGRGEILPPRTGAVGRPRAE